jgi:hypothetical protein
MVMAADNRHMVWCTCSLVVSCSVVLSLTLRLLPSAGVVVMGTPWGRLRCGFRFGFTGMLCGAGASASALHCRGGGLPLGAGCHGITILISRHNSRQWRVVSVAGNHDGAPLQLETLCPLGQR